MTFDTLYSAILLDWVQGIMLVSHWKVLSPGNEGSMAVIVYVSIFPQLATLQTAVFNCTNASSHSSVHCERTFEPA